MIYLFPAVCIPDISKLTPIKEALPDHITFNQIKMVLALLQRKFGMNEMTLDQDSTQVG